MTQDEGALPRWYWLHILHSLPCNWCRNLEGSLEGSFLKRPLMGEQKVIERTISVMKYNKNRWDCYVHTVTLLWPRV